ncbi:MAG TPA: hypothetical protein VGS27_30550 [Candidatus Sulfotelmatobacter sp.]|nr:hypothetical protein [Candidatus Sulfotelmatobacter sp.]
MVSFPQGERERRAPRLHPAEFTPIVIRCRDGRRISGKLNCVSVTGGLVSPSALLPPGSLVNLLFVTSKGPVTGTVEMLHPVSWTEQPFKFAAIPEAHQSRLRAMIQTA